MVTALDFKFATTFPNNYKAIYLLFLKKVKVLCLFSNLKLIKL